MIKGMLSDGELLMLNRQNSPPTFCSDLGQETWIDVSAASPFLVPSIVDWAVWDQVEVLYNHILTIT